MLAKDRLALMGMLDSLAKIERYTSGLGSYADSQTDSMTMDACLMHLVNIGEMVARLSDDVLSAHPEVDWIRIRGLRNIIAPIISASTTRKCGL